MPNSRRIQGLDLARALAYLGMVIVNFEVVMAAGVTDPGWLRWAVTRLEGRASALFVILAGCGLALMAGRRSTDGTQWDRARVSGARRRILLRSAFLFVVGLLYMPLWPGDILHYYGIYLALGSLLLSASSRTLWALAGAASASFAGALLLFDYEAGWDWTTLHYEGFWTPLGFLRNLLFNGFHPVIPWLAFLLLGIWLGRLQLQHSRVRRALLAVSVALALATEIASRLLVRAATPALGGDNELASALLGTSSMPPMPLYLVAAGSTAVAVIALALEVAHLGRASRWLPPLIHTGQLALTLYVGHVVLGMGTLLALGRLEGQTLPFALVTAMGFCLLSVVFAHLWRQRFTRGPLEWLMRAITG